MPRHHLLFQYGCFFKTRVENCLGLIPTAKKPKAASTVVSGQGFLYTLCHLSLMTILRDSYYYCDPHFIDEKIEAQDILPVSKLGLYLRSVSHKGSE